MYTITLPVVDDRPAEDFLRNESFLGLTLSYHRKDHLEILREAFEFTYKRFKDKSTLKS